MDGPTPRSGSRNQNEASVTAALEGFVDSDWYRERYPDVGAADLDPMLHFIRHGLAERRDPNRFFDGAWYTAHYADVAVADLHPLLHYLQVGAAELRNPNANFDAVWYAAKHPNAADNPLLYHITTGLRCGYLTEPPLDIRDYLPVEHPAPSLAHKVVVDIVIPVYRGLEQTRRCINAVRDNTGKPLGRIIVIDDSSPDHALSAWLHDLATSRQIHLVRNPRNLGFVRSVNRGIDVAGRHDVVLLNSDTEVPAGWLSRLAAQVQADPRIATASPFSNNATICGYPANISNPLAFGRTVADIDAVCQTVNAGRWVDVPTTVGFCMYIRREALDAVGLFDAERFTVGYGEENDFCLRATSLGWQHRLACDTFVYHEGAVSFGDRTNKLTARAMKLILERYPDYGKTVARHVSQAAVEPFRFAVTAGLFRQAKLPVILMIAHDLGGGVRRHIDSLVKRYADTARFLLLQASDRGATLSVPSLPGHPALTLPAARTDDLILLLRSMNITRIHIHHLLGMDIDIRHLIQRLNLPFDVTVHDYYAICPQINLLPWRHSLYCQEPDIAACNSCIAHRSSHGARDIVTWRAEHAWQFKQADRVLCPSHDVMSRLRRYGLAANAVYAPHEPVPSAPWPLQVVPPRNGKFRIAILGTLVDHKGGRTVASVAEMIDPRTTQLYLIGHIDGNFPARALKRMTVTGKYDDVDLPRLIETTAPHLIWFPAVWPETFSYTLSAAIASGMPIAATRIGAHTERLAGRPFTWLTEIATSPMAWIKLFDTIRNDLSNAIVTNAPVRPAVNDFYANNYLNPRAKRSAFRSSTARRIPRIVVVPERFPAGPPTPCGYIRLIQPLHYPTVLDAFDVRLTTTDELFDHRADIIVTQRSAIPDLETAERLAAHARATGAILVYDLDDDLLNIPRSHPEAGTLRPSSKMVRRMLDVADSVWLSTDGLAQTLASIRPDAMVMPNGLDERIWTTPALAARDQPVRILCMGTATHDRDFAMIEPALRRLKDEYIDRIQIDIIGMTSQRELPAGLNRVNPSANAMRSYPGFVQWLTSHQPVWHIGLAPLLDTTFNRCKSSIKAMDYAAMGLVVLASDVPAYRGSIADGQAGQLVHNNHVNWYAALNRLLRDWDMRKAIAARSREKFLASSSLASQASTRLGALSRLLTVRSNNAAA